MDAVESVFCFEKQHIARSTWLILHVGICCWTVISNGSYGHLNNHLAHPPSLNSLRFFSPMCARLRALSLSFLGNTTALSEAHALDD